MKILVSLAAANPETYRAMFNKFLTHLGKKTPALRKKLDSVNANIDWAVANLKSHNRIEWFVGAMKMDILSSVEPEQAHELKFPPLGATLKEIKSRLEHYVAREIPEIEAYNFKDGNQPKSFQTINADLQRLEQEHTQKLKDSKTEEKRRSIQMRGQIPFLKIDEKHAWFDLGKPRCKVEQRAMDHCGKSSDPDAITLLSYRECTKPELDIWVPHLTFSVDKRWKLGEMKGEHNHKPASKFFPAIVKLLMDHRIKGIKGGGYKPETNFKLTDLPEKDMNFVRANRPEMWTYTDSVNLMLKKGEAPVYKKTKEGTWFEVPCTDLYVDQSCKKGSTLFSFRIFKGGIWKSIMSAVLWESGYIVFPYYDDGRFVKLQDDVVELLVDPRVKSISTDHEIKAFSEKNKDLLFAHNPDLLTEKERVIKDLLSGKLKTLKYTGDIDLRNSNISKLPDFVEVSGTFDLSNCANLKKLPDRFVVGTLDISRTNITKLPENMQTYHLGSTRGIMNLLMNGCEKIVEIPDINRLFTLSAEGCTSLSKLPFRIEVSRTVSFSGCKKLKIIPDGWFKVPGASIYLADCSIIQLPSRIIGDFLDLSRNPLVELPEVDVLREIELTDCKRLVRIPSLKTHRLVLTGCSALTELPSNLNVVTLYLQGCKKLKTLPDDLNASEVVISPDMMKVVPDKFKDGLHMKTPALVYMGTEKGMSKPTPKITVSETTKITFS